MDNMFALSKLKHFFVDGLNGVAVIIVNYFE